MSLVFDIVMFPLGTAYQAVDPVCLNYEASKQRASKQAQTIHVCDC